MESGFSCLSCSGAAHADDQARAARADDAHRTARIDVVGRERQRIEHGEMLAIVQLAPDRRPLLADGDAAIFARAAHLDVDDARLGLLAQPLQRRRAGATARSARQPSRGRRSRLPCAA